MTQHLTIPAEVKHAVEILTERIMVVSEAKRLILAEYGNKDALAVPMERMVEFFANDAEAALLISYLASFLARSALERESLLADEMVRFNTLSIPRTDLNERLRRQNDAEVAGGHQGRVAAITIACDVLATIPASWWAEQYDDRF